MASYKGKGKIYQSKRGITLVDGFYLSVNKKNNKVNVISVSDGVAHVHYINKRLPVEKICDLEAAGEIDIAGILKFMEK